MPPKAPASPPPPLTRNDFEAAFKRLLKPDATGPNTGCLACEGCERSVDSTFCVDCVNVVRSNYCTGCVDCTECSHCVRATGCLASSHLVDSERCVGSAYLIKCVSCIGCTYCFGCVGLSKKDFHILNQPYDRKTYFEAVEKLKKELRL